MAVLIFAVAFAVLSAGTLGYYLATSPMREQRSPNPQGQRVARSPGLLRGPRDAFALLTVCTIGPAILQSLQLALMGGVFLAPSLVFLPSGLITGLVLVLLLAATSAPTGKRIAIGYALMMPFSLTGMLFGPLVFGPAVLAATVYGVPPPLVGMIVALMASSYERPGNSDRAPRQGSTGAHFRALLDS